MKFLLTFCCYLLVAAGMLPGQSLMDRLKALPDVTFVESVPPKAHFQSGFHLGLRQPVDHADPKQGTFVQHLYLFHSDADAPMIMETEGYRARPYPRELSRMLHGNQINVEHRYHGESVPEPLKWKYLKAEQAVQDLHHVRELFRDLYPGKWVSTGISKGGKNSLMYRSFYPDDVAATVAYVAPVIRSREDPRVWTHVETVGKKKCREALVVFQREMLIRRTEMLSMLKIYAEKNDRHFSIGYEKVLEYAAMEFPFSFWQWGGNCETLPGKTAPTSEFFDLVHKLVSWDFYCDRDLARLAPSYYQHSVELGYYGFDDRHVRDLIQAVTVMDNTVFSPQGEDLEHHPELVQGLEQFLDEKGDRIMYIYGGYDTWGACAIIPSPKRDAVNMTLKKGDHKTRIMNFPKGKRKKIYKTLERWLELDVVDLN